MNISIATLQDAPELAALINSAYRGEDATHGWTHEANLLDGLRTDVAGITEMMQKDNAVILKCCNDDGVIEGCVYLEKNEPRLYLGMLTVKPKLQSLGMGKKLLQASEDYAFTHACYTIEMTVISMRHELIKWYEKHGYTNTGVTKPFPTETKFGIPKQALEFVVLEKKLG